jgi:choline-sulfatase
MDRALLTPGRRCRTNRVRAALVAAMAVLAPGSCRQPPRQPLPNVLLVTIDTLRADHCSAYGYGRPTTPTLERLARRGVLFETAYAPIATTTPSHATMLTGRLPREHGLIRNGQALPTGQPTLTDILRLAGYRTAAFVSSFALDHRFGLARGFETYDDDFGPAAPPRSEPWEGHRLDGAFDRTADRTCRRALGWLGVQGYLGPPVPGRPPFFLWVHFFDPHDPYSPPPAHERLFPPPGPQPSELDRQIARYDGEIHFADSELGRLLDELDRVGLLAQTMTIVAGDHGEGLMQHGHMGHGLMIYEEAVRVPLLVLWPRAVRGPRRVAGPVQLLDLTPTVLDLLGKPLRTDGHGRSLAGILRGQESPDPQRDVFLQRRQYLTETVGSVHVKGEKIAVREGRWKYIEAPEEGTYELYDLDADPHELRNLYQPSVSQASLLAGKLQAWRQSVRPPPLLSVSDEDARRLRSLGYVQ